MAILPKLYAFPTAASTAQNFPESIEQIQNMLFVSVTGVICNLAVVTGAPGPGTTQVQFTGTVTSPSTAFNIGTSQGANALIIANAVPAAGNPAGA